MADNFVIPPEADKSAGGGQVLCNKWGVWCVYTILGGIVLLDIDKDDREFFYQRRSFMQLKKIFVAGTISGITMGIFLFIGGAILSRIIYGPQFVPPGKFKPEQINAFYFIWTKLVIGWFFGLLFTFVYEMLPLRTKMAGIFYGLKYGFVFWLLISLWNISHPLIYGTVDVPEQIFWLLYQLVGFLAFGATLGHIYKRRARRELIASGNQTT